MLITAGVGSLSENLFVKIVYVKYDKMKLGEGRDGTEKVEWKENYLSFYYFFQ